MGKQETGPAVVSSSCGFSSAYPSLRSHRRDRADKGCAAAASRFAPSDSNIRVCHQGAPVLATRVHGGEGLAWDGRGEMRGGEGRHKLEGGGVRSDAGWSAERLRPISKD